MRTWTRLLLLTTLAACSVATRPTPLPLPKATVCEIPPEPEWKNVAAEYVGDANSTCLAPHVVCLDLVATKTLTANLNAMKAWREEVIARCGSAPALPVGDLSSSADVGSSGVVRSAVERGSSSSQRDE